MAGESENKKRDFWDKLSTFSIFLSSVVIGIAGLVINSSYNERESLRMKENAEKEHQIAKVQTLATFTPFLSGNKESKEAAVFAISILGYPELAIRISQLQQEDQKTSDAIMRSAPQSIAPQLVAQFSPEKVLPKNTGWIYLGDYSVETGSWKTQYLNFDNREEPENLKNKSFAISRRTGAINVRAGMPTDAGEFLGIVKVLQPDLKVEVVEIKQWLTTGYTWAMVRF
jgi:hypothetical protein